MDIVQTFYDDLASSYDRLFKDWTAETRDQACILDRLFEEFGFDNKARLLDCACGIGTQAVGLAELGYRVAASDFSRGALSEAEARAADRKVEIRFEHADFRSLESVFSDEFDIVIAMDNALPHMLSGKDLEKAVSSIAGRVRPGGIFAASIRDYDSLLKETPPYSPPYIHKTQDGQRVSFQTWDWSGNHYHLTQYIIDDGASLKVSKFECEYRAVKRNELSALLKNTGFSQVIWKFPEETGFYQPIVIGIRQSQNNS